MLSGRDSPTRPLGELGERRLQATSQLLDEQTWGGGGGGRAGICIEQAPQESRGTQGRGVESEDCLAWGGGGVLQANKCLSAPAPRGKVSIDTWFLK